MLCFQNSSGWPVHRRNSWTCQTEAECLSATLSNSVSTPLPAMGSKKRWCSCWKQTCPMQQKKEIGLIYNIITDEGHEAPFKEGNDFTCGWQPSWVISFPELDSDQRRKKKQIPFHLSQGGEEPEGLSETVLPETVIESPASYSAKPQLCSGLRLHQEEVHPSEVIMGLISPLL